MATNAASAPTLASPRTPKPLRFTLTGPSDVIDHAVSAARRDLADIALAGRWFAPHYAVPERWTCGRAESALQSVPDHESDPVGMLSPGEQFFVLEMSGSWSWGFRETGHLVGYVKSEALVRDHDVARP